MYRRYNHDGIVKYLDDIKKIKSDFEVELDSEYFVDIENNIVIGFALLKKNNGEYYLDDIVVAKEYRYKSHGTKLLNQVKHYIASKGGDRLWLNCSQEDEGFFYKNHFHKQNDKLVLDRLMEDQKRRKEGVFGTVISIIINVFLSAFKVFFGIIGNSQALIADGVHSMSDVAGSVVILLSINMSSKPADEEHPRGHGKIESIAGTIVGVLLIITAFELVSENINGLKNSGEIVIPNTFTIAVAFISIIIKYALYVYKNSMGRRLKNDAIIADAKEHRSDVISTIGVLVGLALSIKVHPIFDPVAGMVVSVFIAKEGFMIIKETSDKILDTQDMEMVEKIRVYCNSFEEIYDTHDIILTYSGNKVFSSLHIRVDRFMTVEDAHKLSDDLKYSILSDFGEISDVTIHIDPLVP